MGTSPLVPVSVPIRDLAADAAGGDGLRQRARTAQLQNVIHAAATGKFHYLGTPFRHRPIIQSVIGTQGTGAREFLIRRGGQDDPCAHGLCDLQRKNRHAAGSGYQYGVAGFQTAITDQCAPGGDPRGGQSRTLRRRPAARHVGEPGGRPHDTFARITIHAVAGDRGEIAIDGLLSQPLRKEGRHHTITRPELRNSSTNGFDLTGAVGQRNPVHGVGRIKAGHGVVVEIQRASMDPNLDLPDLRVRGFRQIDSFKRSRPPLRPSLMAFMVRSINRSTPTRCPLVGYA